MGEERVVDIFSMIGGLFNIVGGGVKGFFGVKEAQANIISDAVKVVGTAISTEADKQKAVASVMVADAGSGYWLAACIRPLMLVVLFGLLVAWYFGYSPINLRGPTPAVIGDLIDLIKFMAGGYIGGRTLEKMTDTLAKAGVLKALMK